VVLLDREELIKEYRKALEKEYKFLEVPENCEEAFRIRAKLIAQADRESDYKLEICGSWVENGEERFTKWKPSTELDFLYAYPSIHRTVLRNELLFEFDEDVSKAKIVLDCLKGYGAYPLVGFSGGRGFHIHVWIKRGDYINRYSDLIAEYGFTVKNLTATIVKAIGKIIKIDVDPVVSSRHMIREFYSIHPSGYFKVPVEKLKPLKIRAGMKFEPVEIEYPYWNPPYDLLDLVFELMVEEREEQKKKAEEMKKKKRKAKNGRIAWIEKILQNPAKVSEGRRRILMYAIIPYLLNVLKKPPNEVEEICLSWVERTPRGDDNGLRYLIKSEIKSYSQSGVLPMSKENFFERFRELNYLRKVLEI